MYFNLEHKQRVEQRGDGYSYIGSYKRNEVTIDGKHSKSKELIRIKCPYCGKKYDVDIYTFRDGAKCKYCCNYYEKSLAYYIQQELKESLNKYWNWEKNDENPYCISYGSNKTIWLLCKEKDYHNDEGGYPTTPKTFHMGNECPYCASKKIHPKDSFGQWLIDTYGNDAIEKYWSPKNIINPFEISKRSTNKIYMLCQEKDYHNDNGGYPITCDNFYNGKRCPYCVGKKVHPKDSFGALYPSKVKYWSKNNNKTPFEVTPKLNDKYNFICEKCGKEFNRSLWNARRTNYNLICINCNSSQLETKTKDILEKYNIKYNTQVKYEHLIGINNGDLSYDFYLPDYNLLIECQGEQHERWIKGWITKTDFKKQLEHDKRKKKYAIDHNIRLLEIWYYDLDNIEEILLKELK